MGGVVRRVGVGRGDCAGGPVAVGAWRAGRGLGLEGRGLRLHKGRACAHQLDRVASAGVDKRRRMGPVRAAGVGVLVPSVRRLPGRSS